MTPTDLSLLRAVIDRIIPADEKDPGALALHTDHYVQSILTTDAAPQLPAITQGLASLPKDFLTATPEEQDTHLLHLEHTSWFRSLVELTNEGFYANPANGGNKDARSWQMIGYQHRLPEGPDGPPPPTAPQ